MCVDLQEKTPPTEAEFMYDGAEFGAEVRASRLPNISSH